MDNNLSDMMEKLLNGNDVPNNVKEMFSSIMNNSSNSGSPNKNSDNSNSNNSNNCNNTDSSGAIPDLSGLDINTILKMQKIIKSMNSEQNSSRANLLRSLKPYLNHSRQKKVDQYIQLLNMEKVFEMLNNDGGGKK